MRKIMVLLLLVTFVCSSVWALCPYAPSAMAASYAARQSAKRQREEREQHEKEYHQGNLVYDVSFSERYQNQEPLPIIEKYEVRRYYYEIDPDKCTIKKELVLKGLRLATIKEIRNEYVCKFVLIDLFIAVIVMLIVAAVYAIKRRE